MVFSPSLTNTSARVATATFEPETGLVIRYHYLWQRQALTGEETA